MHVYNDRYMTHLPSYNQKVGPWDLGSLSNFSYTTLTEYDFMYMYTYIHAYIQNHACLSVCYLCI